MKKIILITVLMISSIVLTAQAIIIDHTCTDISKIPPNWIDQAKTLLHLSYGHTSHGSQLVTGITAIKSIHPEYNFNTNGAISANTLSLHDTTPAGDLGNPDRTTWASRTRTYLNGPSGTGPSRNVVMWSWCGQVDGSITDIETYLSLMSQLETDYPNVKFIYMTGHLNGSGTTGGVNQRNNQIRTYCQANNKILFDFADIESYDPDGLNHYMPKMCDDGCNYDSDGNGSRDKNWANDWIAAHPTPNELTDLATACGDCAHSVRLNCIMKGRAFWWLMARLAGWNGQTGGSVTITFPNGGESLRTGNTYPIAWTVDGYSGPLSIELFQGTNRIRTIASPIPASDLSYNWVAGQIQGSSSLFKGSNLRIRISSTSGAFLAEVNLK